MYRRRYVLQTYLALLVVVAGVGFSTYGDYGWTNWGLFLTLLGTLLAALKTVVTNMMLVGRLKLNPLDLLMRMSPMAFVQCVVYSWYSGEMARVREYGATQMTQSKAIALAINGVIAFGLNVVSFTANKKTSALTMTVAGACRSTFNRKAVLTDFTNVHSQRQAGLDHRSRRLVLQSDSHADQLFRHLAHPRRRSVLCQGRAGPKEGQGGAGGPAAGAGPVAVGERGCGRSKVNERSRAGGATIPSRSSASIEQTAVTFSTSFSASWSRCA